MNVEIPVTETDKGRVRQLVVTLILAVLLTVGLMMFLWYRGGADDGEAASNRVYLIYTVGIVLLGINYINDNVLLQLVKRVPLPKRLIGNSQGE